MVKTLAPRSYHTWPLWPPSVSRLMTVHPISNLSSHFGIYISQSCINSCHDTFDRPGRECETWYLRYPNVKKIIGVRYGDREGQAIALIIQLTFVDRSLLTLSDIFPIVCWSSVVLKTESIPHSLGSIFNQRRWNSVQKSTYPWAFSLSDSR
jgi:hypothetical protein